MRKVLVHLHIYYHDQTDYFVGKLSNISGCEWDLYVTMNAREETTVLKLKSFKPDVKIIETENRGYDVWPFIKVIKSVNLDSYDYILKLHTKSESMITSHRIRLDGYKWRNALVDSLIGSRLKFRTILKMFAKHPDTGIISCDMLWLETIGWLNYDEDKRLLDNELDRIGLTVRDRHFCVGTIFMARSCIFKFLQKDNISPEIFPDVLISHSGGSMAHVYERILSMASDACGYRAMTTFPNCAMEIYIRLSKLITYIFGNIFAITREGEWGIKYIRIFGMKIRTGRLRGLMTKIRILVRGHLLNPLVWPHWQRSRTRENVIRNEVDRYLDCCVSDIMSVKPDTAAEEEGRPEERIFSIWLQGEENAPEIVKACFASIRANCTQQLVVLDAKNIWEWISLPGYIRKLWESGKMKPAHFADICRVELLYRYGGVWLDATDFTTSPVPDWIMDEDFFIYMGGKTVKGHYAFVQNCFFRAKKGNYIVKVWREGIFSYWRHENTAIDYFIHQMILRKAVECNAEAGAEFARMPHVDQDPTHELWWQYRDKPFDAEIFRAATSRSFFQKIEYKSATANSPVPGTFADVMMKMYRQK